MMKKLLSLVTAILLLLSVCACTAAEEPAPMMAGGWLICQDGVMTEDAQAAFDKAVADLKDVANIEAVRLLATQVVAGINYSVLALNDYNGDVFYSVLTIYADLSGNATVTMEQYLTPGGFQAAPEDNPAMDYIGTYMDSNSQRAVLTISCVDEDLALLEVEWANSAADGFKWNLTCSFDPETRKFTYTDGSKLTYTCDEDGEITYTDVQQGLSGAFEVREDGCILWLAEGEDADNGCIFEYCE